MSDVAQMEPRQPPFRQPCAPQPGTFSGVTFATLAFIFVRCFSNRIPFMAYEYDVFLSYRSKSRDWVQKIFLPDFQHYLEESIRNATIFVDWHDVMPGDAWAARLKRGLAHSRCLVSLLTSRYFESDWCTKEFAVFENRSRQNGLLTTEAPSGLILPLALDSRERFPAVLGDIQMPDWDYYYSASVKGYKKIKKYQKLQDELKILARNVARRIRLAPPWNPDWLQDDWLEVPANHLRIDDVPFHVPQPRI